MSTPSRREFLKTSSLAAATAAAGTLALARSAHAAGSDILKIGLVGCGGRGTKAAVEALRADENTRLTALADAFDDRLAMSLRTLQAREDVGSRVDVPAERQFVGFDGYQKLIDSGVDVVLLATPPGFRPIHLKACVDAGRHVFAEKPVAVDAPGVRSVLATCEAAKKKNLAIVSGLCLRYGTGLRETVGRIHDGALGELRVLQANDYRGPIWVRTRKADMTEMQYQMRNWYYYTWLCGDFNVEQHVHYLDVCSWLMKGEYPVKALGLGGRQQRTGDQYGHIFDHHSVVYEYADGQRLVSNCRQQQGLKGDISCYVFGERGWAEVDERALEIKSDKPWKFTGKDNDIYQAEHDALFASIRSGQPINNGQYMAKSTLLAIMGRMATYTGQEITWEMALGSKEDLSPPQYTWDCPLPSPKPAVPGVTKFV